MTVNGGDVRRAGVTIIEVLVVAACLVLLLAMLLPSLTGAAGAARAVACQANLRQWACAATLYAEAHERYLPRRGQGVQPVTVINRPEDWFNALPPFLSQRTFYELAEQQALPHRDLPSLWLCPEARLLNTPLAFSYGMNMRLSPWQAPRPDRIDEVGPPAVQVFMSDAPGSHCSVLPSAQSYSPVARHAGDVNIAFLDTHVLRLGGPDVGCGIGDPHLADVQWVVPNSQWAGPP